MYFRWWEEALNFLLQMQCSCSFWKPDAVQKQHWFQLLLQRSIHGRMKPLAIIKHCLVRQSTKRQGPRETFTCSLGYVFQYGNIPYEEAGMDLSSENFWRCNIHEVSFRTRVSAASFHTSGGLSNCSGNEFEVLGPQGQD
ncbi:hypothetical protein RvY_04573 [Ramazzottius varieornatus]|uniref:Uncharacterized protein n=1 Tax=Ramazzottius varieornatus TaxID=947166 RepID=A0A1D1UYR8_RAMVA|nr:hypothetical protein RvY_04573 [Ramazzottius varieornatus]